MIYIIHYISIVVIPANPSRWHDWGKKHHRCCFTNLQQKSIPSKNWTSPTQQNHSWNTTTTTTPPHPTPPSRPPTELPPNKKKKTFSNPKNPRKKIKSRRQWFHRQGTKGLKTWMPIHDFVTPLSKLIPRVEWRNIIKRIHSEPCTLS